MSLANYTNIDLFNFTFLESFDNYVNRFYVLNVFILLFLFTISIDYCGYYHFLLSYILLIHC
jgi:hypothetical protein